MTDRRLRRSVVLAATLAVASGATDVLCVTRLGPAFASVITGNLVTAGVQVGRADWRGLGPPAVAVGSYAAGVALGSAVLRGSDPDGGQWLWRRRIVAVLGVELLLLAGLAVGWAATAGRTGGAPALLAVAAVAMGLQSTAAGAVGLAGVSTTYMTGTLTGLVGGLVDRGRFNGGAALALVGVLVGALLCGLLVVAAAPWAGLLPPALLLVVVLAALVRVPRAAR